MAKKLDNQDVIHFELERLEKKVEEFQTYLEKNSILTPPSSNYGDGVDNQDKLHKEMVLQIKVQSALFEWLPLLAKLRDRDNRDKAIKTRGDVEINGLFNQKMNQE